MSFVLAFLACWIAGAPGFAATVDRIDVERGRIVIHFDDGVAAASSFVLDGPRRIAVDVTGAQPGGVAATGGAVAQVRQGAREGDGARIVFDLVHPAIVTSGNFADGGRTLTLALASVDVGRFSRAVGQGRTRYSVKMPVPPPARGVDLPRVAGDDTRPLVVIDAGHGGHDPGAISPDTGLQEKDVTLRIAKAIRDQLIKDGRVRVALTRSDDRYLMLRERFQIARRLNADLFISIHCDSAANPAATGATVYTLSEVASDKEAARLAARENRADILDGVNLAATSTDISSILIDLSQRETMNSSSEFASLLGREARQLVPMKDTFHRMASLMVLKAPDMPSVLFETGYISNDQDAAFLDSAGGRHRIAQAMSRAINVYFARQMASR